MIRFIVLACLYCIMYTYSSTALMSVMCLYTAAAADRRCLETTTKAMTHCGMMETTTALMLHFAIT